MKDSYPGMLRESLLVRAVSQMENYLVELLRVIARRDLTPFKQQDKVLTFSQAHLLSFHSADLLRDHILDAECRGLNGKGFREFEKYYKRRFNIAFSQSAVSVDSVDEIYARRHILVHAGGHVDEQYCRRFAKNMRPGERLVIGEEYFLAATEKLESLALYCAERVEALFPDPAGPVSPPIERLLGANEDAVYRIASVIPEEKIPLAHWLSATFTSAELLDKHFSNGSVYESPSGNTEVGTLIVAKERKSDSTMHWLVCGPKAAIGAYIGYVAYLERKGMIQMLEKHNIPLVKGHPNWKPQRTKARSNPVDSSLDEES